MAKTSEAKIVDNATKTIVIEKKISKASYEKIAKSINDWPQWKKNLCNQELIISVKSKKI